MQSTMSIPQLNLIESLAVNLFPAIRQCEGESLVSTMSFHGMPLLTPISTTIHNESTSIEHAQGTSIDDDIRKNIQASFLISKSGISAIALLLKVVDYDDMQKTSWMPFKRDEIDELRELAIRSLYHSMDIGVDFSGDLLNFCYKCNIMKYVKISVDLIKACFPSYETVSAELMEDMETDEKWVLLNIFVRDEVDRILDMYDKYTEEWIDKVPWPECSRVRISYHPI